MISILSILQFVLAIHTAIGAVWKYSHSEQTVPSLKAIPHKVWLGMGIFEMLCSACLVLTLFYQPFPYMASIAAACIGAEMLVFCILHLQSGNKIHSQMLYWLVVAALCVFVAYSANY